MSATKILLGKLRRCRKCGATKDLSLFVRHSDHPDGYMAICKECRRRSGSTRTR